MTLAELAVIAGIYAATVLSPGPSTMAIAATAMARGRGLALAFAGGVLTGSVAWALMAAFGMSALMTANAWAAEGVRVAGGLYLLWLGWRSARAALRRAPPEGRAFGGRDLGLAYARGLALHLTNPKAILFWGALFAMAVEPGTPVLALAEIVAVCALIGAAVFLGFAVLFSTGRAMQVYSPLRRGLEGGFAAVFAGAGLALLTGRLA